MGKRAKENSSLNELGLETEPNDQQKDSPRSQPLKNDKKQTPRGNGKKGKAKKNEGLTEARRNRKDEFYTQLSDIEKELSNYRHLFKDKIVFCNCDDPYESNFFKYFALNFNQLGLKKLIATCYSGSPVSGNQIQLFEDENDEDDLLPGYKIEINGVKDLNNDGAVDLLDIEQLLLQEKNTSSRLLGNGDFKSPEAIELLKQCDIVVTNPPFSLFRDFITQLIEHNKQFLVLGSEPAVSYAEIWPLIQKGKIWMGVNSGPMSFRVPEYYEARPSGYWQDDTGQKWRKLGNICWFTNLDHSKRHQNLALFKRFAPEDYPSFNFYRAINVDAIKDIPVDYFEPMGVPITFLNKHNPDQFELLDANDFRNGAPRKRHGLIKDSDGSVGSKNKFVRILIRRKNANNS